MKIHRLTEKLLVGEHPHTDGLINIYTLRHYDVMCLFILPK